MLSFPTCRSLNLLNYIYQSWKEKNFSNFVTAIKDEGFDYTCVEKWLHKMSIGLNNKYIKIYIKKNYILIKNKYFDSDKKRVKEFHLSYNEINKCLKILINHIDKFCSYELSSILWAITIILLKLFKSSSSVDTSVCVTCSEFQEVANTLVHNFRKFFSLIISNLNKVKDHLSIDESLWAIWSLCKLLYFNVLSVGIDRNIRRGGREEEEEEVGGSEGNVNLVSINAGEGTGKKNDQLINLTKKEEPVWLKEEDRSRNREKDGKIECTFHQVAFLMNKFQLDEESVKNILDIFNYIYIKLYNNLNFLNEKYYIYIPFIIFESQTLLLRSSILLLNKIIHVILKRNILLSLFNFEKLKKLHSTNLAHKNADKQNTNRHNTDIFRIKTLSKVYKLIKCISKIFYPLKNPNIRNLNLHNNYTSLDVAVLGDFVSACNHALVKYLDYFVFITQQRGFSQPTMHSSMHSSMQIDMNEVIDADLVTDPVTDPVTDTDEGNIWKKGASTVEIGKVVHDGKAEEGHSMSGKSSKEKFELKNRARMEHKNELIFIYNCLKSSLVSLIKLDLKDKYMYEWLNENIHLFQFGNPSEETGVGPNGMKHFLYYDGESMEKAEKSEENDAEKSTKKLGGEKSVEKDDDTMENPHLDESSRKERNVRCDSSEDHHPSGENILQGGKGVGMSSSCASDEGREIGCPNNAPHFDKNRSDELMALHRTSIENDIKEVDEKLEKRPLSSLCGEDISNVENNSHDVCLDVLALSKFTKLYSTEMKRKLIENVKRSIEESLKQLGYIYNTSNEEMNYPRYISINDIYIVKEKHIKELYDEETKTFYQKNRKMKFRNIIMPKQLAIYVNYLGRNLNLIETKKQLNEIFLLSVGYANLTKFNYFTSNDIIHFLQGLLNYYELKKGSSNLFNEQVNKMLTLLCTIVENSFHKWKSSNICQLIYLLTKYKHIHKNIFNTFDWLLSKIRFPLYVYQKANVDIQNWEQIFHFNVMNNESIEGEEEKGSIREMEEKPSVVSMDNISEVDIKSIRSSKLDLEERNHDLENKGVQFCINEFKYDNLGSAMWAISSLNRHVIKKKYFLNFFYFFSIYFSLHMKSFLNEKYGNVYYSPNLFRNTIEHNIMKKKYDNDEDFLQENSHFFKFPLDSMTISIYVNTFARKIKIGFKFLFDVIYNNLNIVSQFALKELSYIMYSLANVHSSALSDTVFHNEHISDEASIDTTCEGAERDDVRRRFGMFLHGSSNALWVDEQDDMFEMVGRVRSDNGKKGIEASERKSPGEDEINNVFPTSGDIIQTNDASSSVKRNEKSVKRKKDFLKFKNERIKFSNIFLNKLMEKIHNYASSILEKEKTYIQEATSNEVLHISNANKKNKIEIIDLMKLIYSFFIFLNQKIQMDEVNGINFQMAEDIIHLYSLIVKSFPSTLNYIHVIIDTYALISNVYALDEFTRGIIKVDSIPLLCS